jgi:hypothetical protein
VYSIIATRHFLLDLNELKLFKMGTNAILAVSEQYNYSRSVAR